MPFRQKMIMLKEMFAAAMAMISSFSILPNERTSKNRNISDILSSIVVDRIGERIAMRAIMRSSFQMKRDNGSVLILFNIFDFRIFQIEKSCGIINKRHLSSPPTLFLTLVYMNEEKMSPFFFLPQYLF